MALQVDAWNRFLVKHNVQVHKHPGILTEKDSTYSESKVLKPCSSAITKTTTFF
jgi:hypothetical protein